MNQPIDNLEGITGVKLSDMLGKEIKDIDEKSGLLSREHLDNCSGCALCEE